MTKYDIYMKRPASVFIEKWRDGSPIGNGLTGINLYGGVARETYIVSRYDMWSTVGKGINEAPVVYDCIEKMRSLAKEGKWAEASTVLHNRFKELGYGALGKHMRCLCQVAFYFECNGVCSDYTRCLHTDKAEADITYKIDDRKCRRRAFVSRKSDIAVSEFDFDEGTSFKADAAYFDSMEDGREDHIKTVHLENERYDVIDDCYIYTSMNDDQTYCGVVMKIISDGGVKTSGKGIEVEKAEKATVYIKAFSSEKSRDEAIEKAVQSIKECTAGYEEMLAEHIALYQKYFFASDINIYNSEDFHSNEELLMTARDKECSAELLEKLWHFGRYLFISGTNTEGHPFPLYGLWASGYDRPWSQNVANENVEMMYWHTTVGGLNELVKPLVNYYYSMMDKFRESAKNIYNCRGIYVCVYTAPGMSTPVGGVPVLYHFIGTGGWLARHFYDYYIATGDEEFFEEKILPFMLEVALFYEDYLYEGEDGMIEIYPSVSPENTPKEFHDVDLGLGHPMPVYKNATIEFAILKELFGNLIEISKTRPELSERAEKWKKIAERIPDYMINEDGAVAEWTDKNVHDWYFHRHLSHVYPLFPGTEIEDSGREDLIPAFEKAVDMRVLGSYTGWSLAHMSAIYARLGRGEKAYKMINMLTKVCLLENFFTMHNDFRSMGITAAFGPENFAPVQLDAVMGTVNAMQEWLIRLTKNKVYLLPSCPEKLESGSVKDFRIFGGRVSFEWNLKDKFISAEITADKDIAETEIILPFGKASKIISLKKGDKININ